VHPGSAAESSGLIATGDLLHAVDNVSVYGKTPDEVLKKKPLLVERVPLSITTAKTSDEVIKERKKERH
jgi:C-terminal processing protease CtpA/Prc